MRTFSIHTVRNLFAVVVIVGLGYLAYTANPASVTGPKVEAGNGDNVSGWAYSETIGWISFNSTNESSGSSYGVNISPTTGTGFFSGSAWSRGTTENGGVGWISFDQADTATCVTAYGGTRAQVDWSTGAVTGWARALSGSTASGWDGCIKLAKAPSDTGAAYGVSISPSDGRFSGWAWGSDVVGWISFADSTLGPNSYFVQGPVSVTVCQNGQAYDEQSSLCVYCGNGGCSGTGGSSANPTGGLVCNAGGSATPPMCTCGAAETYFGGQCVANCPNGATVASSCATCPSGQTFNASNQCANVKPKYQQF